jgi:hypothetical protein
MDEQHQPGLWGSLFTGIVYEREGRLWLPSDKFGAFVRALGAPNVPKVGGAGAGILVRLMHHLGSTAGLDLRECAWTVLDDGRRSSLPQAMRDDRRFNYLVIMLLWAMNLGLDMAAICRTCTVLMRRAGEVWICESCGSLPDGLPVCQPCGTRMRLAGNCFVCQGCGSTSGIG